MEDGGKPVASLLAVRGLPAVPGKCLPLFRLSDRGLPFGRDRQRVQHEEILGAPAEEFLAIGTEYQADYGILSSQGEDLPRGERVPQLHNAVRGGRSKAVAIGTEHQVGDPIRVSRERALLESVPGVPDLDETSGIA